MYTPGFSSTFLPASHKLVPSLQAQTSHTVERRRPISAHQPLDVVTKSIKQLPLLATGVAAYAFLSTQKPFEALRQSPTANSTTLAYNNSADRLGPSSSSSVIAVKPVANVEDEDARKVELVSHVGYVRPTKGALLEVYPPPENHAAIPNLTTDLTDHQIHESVTAGGYSGTNYSAGSSASTPVPEWAAAGMQRTVPASDGLMRLRSMVRPTLIGLVGVGAFTTGSMFLRSLTRKDRTIKRSSPEPTVAPAKLGGTHSVLSLHVPFCAPDRGILLERLNELANTASIVTPDGMAKAARDAATLLLDEVGLMEDSRKFAPYMDVFLAENYEGTQRRFSGHVVTEESRIERILGKTVGYDVGPNADLGKYGVVSLVLATREGVNLECYDENMTVVGRLRAALNAVRRVKGGDILGMEMRWVPEEKMSRSLTRGQLSDAYPFLRVT